MSGYQPAVQWVKTVPRKAARIAEIPCKSCTCKRCEELRCNRFQRWARWSWRAIRKMHGKA